MNKGGLDIDPRGLIFESYRIEGISSEECRTIFLDWALGVPSGEGARGHIGELLAHYGAAHPDHPMTEILREGTQHAAGPARRRGGRKGRQ